MNFNELMTQRRAINYFDTSRTVTEEEVKQIIETASKTPSSFNLQPWNVMILRDQAQKQKLQQLAWDQPKVSEAPVVFIILADADGWREGHPIVEKSFQEMIKAGFMNIEQRDWYKGARESLYGGDPSKELAFAVKNTGFFAMSLMLAAKDLGIDSHPMDGFDHEGVKKAFNIPDPYWIPLLLALGYMKPGVDLAQPKWRKSYAEIIKTF